MVSLLASSVVDRGFETLSRQTKDYKIGICCFSTKHTAVKTKSKDWFSQYQDNVSEWGDMFIRELSFQWASTIKIQLSVLVQYKADLIIISLKISLFLPWYSYKICWVGIKQQLHTHLENDWFQYFFILEIIAHFFTISWTRKLLYTSLVHYLNSKWYTCFYIKSYFLCVTYRQIVNFKYCYAAVI